MDRAQRHPAERGGVEHDVAPATGRIGQLEREHPRRGSEGGDPMGQRGIVVGGLGSRPPLRAEQPRHRLGKGHLVIGPAGHARRRCDHLHRSTAGAMELRRQDPDRDGPHVGVEIGQLAPPEPVDEPVPGGPVLPAGVGQPQRVAPGRLRVEPLDRAQSEPVSHIGVEPGDRRSAASHEIALAGAQAGPFLHEQDGPVVVQHRDLTQVVQVQRGASSSTPGSSGRNSS